MSVVFPCKAVEISRRQVPLSSVERGEDWYGAWVVTSQRHSLPTLRTTLSYPSALRTHQISCRYLPSPHHPYVWPYFQKVQTSSGTQLSCLAVIGGILGLLKQGSMSVMLKLWYKFFSLVSLYFHKVGALAILLNWIICWCVDFLPIYSEFFLRCQLCCPFFLCFLGGIPELEFLFSLFFTFTFKNVSCASVSSYICHSSGFLTQLPPVLCSLLDSSLCPIFCLSIM